MFRFIDGQKRNDRNHEKSEQRSKFKYWLKINHLDSNIPQTRLDV